MKTKKDCKEHTEYGRHLSDSQCPYAENEVTHTPWMLANYKQWVISKGGLTLATMQAYKGFEVDAEFIVRAVNAHEEMLTLFKRGLECGIFDDAPVYREDVQAVIAKAEGK